MSAFERWDSQAGYVLLLHKMGTPDKTLEGVFFSDIGR